MENKEALCDRPDFLTGQCPLDSQACLSMAHGALAMDLREKKTPLGPTLLHTRMQKETSWSHPHAHRASTARIGPSRCAHG